MNKRYVCINEYVGCKVGDLQEIDEWLSDEGATASASEFYELGKPISVKLVVVEPK